MKQVLSTVEFCHKNCCPTVEHFISEGEEKFAIGGVEEGITIFTKDQFADFIGAVREGKFDSLVVPRQ